jgi:hypothetical protein
MALVMGDYYEILFQEETHLGVGYTVAESDLFFLPDTGKVKNWNPIILELRDGQYPDYLASDLGCRLCSKRLKDVLAAEASASDSLQWLDVLVRTQYEERLYFILHFPEPPDVLDKRKTIFAGDTDVVVKAVLSRDAVTGHKVFAYPKCGCLPLFISKDVKRRIRVEKCTGMDIPKVPIA